MKRSKIISNHFFIYLKISKFRNVILVLRIEHFEINWPLILFLDGFFGLVNLWSHFEVWTLHCAFWNWTNPISYNLRFWAQQIQRQNKYSIKYAWMLKKDCEWPVHHIASRNSQFWITKFLGISWQAINLFWRKI